MPKIYGKVRLINRDELRCETCGYIWTASNEELTDIREGRKVTCLHCRAMNYLKAGEIIPKNREFMISSAVKVSNPDELRGENYQDKLAEVTHLRCKRNFKAKLIDIRQGNLECPHCKLSIKKTIDEFKKSDSTSAKKQTSLVEVIDSKDKVEEADRVPLKDKDSKIGKVLKNGIRVMNIDESRGTYTIQCIRCGTEETRDLSLLKKAKDKNSILVCSRCSKNEISIEQLRKEYIGKIFNGQRIEEIYYGDNGEVLCNLICMQNKGNMSLASYIKAINNKNSATSSIKYIGPDNLHSQTGVLLGDVINKRCHCKICGSAKIATSTRFKAALVCPNMNDFRKMGKPVKLNIENITVSDFYDKVKTGTLCEYCSAKDICKASKLDPRNNLSVISAQLDMTDSLINDMMDININYPSMFQFKESDSNNLEVLPDKDLIVIKEAFINRDGVMYKTCKCRQHGTELLLTEAEIASFNHIQCMENNKYMKFFNLSGQVYLGKPEKEK